MNEIRPLSEADTLPVLGPDAFEQLSESEAAKLLAAIVGTLTARQQSVIVLRYRKDKSFSQIAGHLRIRKTNAHWLHKRAIKTIKDRLAVMGIFAYRDVM